MRYGKGNRVTATGGVALENRRRPDTKARKGLPYLKIMVAVIALVLLGLALLVLTTH
jgi:hypothetical protein